MTINGKEVKFSFTIGAAAQLAPLCPGEDLNNLFGIFEDKLTKENLERLAQVLAILSGGTLTAAEINNMNFYQLRQLETAAAEAIKSDTETEIETKNAPGAPL